MGAGMRRVETYCQLFGWRYCWVLQSTGKSVLPALLLPQCVLWDRMRYQDGAWWRLTREGCQVRDPGGFRGQRAANCRPADGAGQHRGASLPDVPVGGRQAPEREDPKLLHRWPFAVRVDIAFLPDHPVDQWKEGRSERLAC